VARQPVEQRHAVGNDADLPLHLERIGVGIEPEDLDRPRVFAQEPGEHADGRRLAGAVGP
jgi:hypothetical protein